MESLLTYNLKLSICIALFYIAYKLLFSKETFHRSNRFILLGICTFTLLIPSITFEINESDTFFRQVHSYQQALIYSPDNNEIAKEGNHSGDSLTLIEANDKVPKGTNWISILSIIYFTGIIILFFKLILSVFRITNIIFNHKKRRLDTGILIIHQKDIAPFSWFNYIFISQNDYSSNGEIIIKHEQAHIISHHSLDCK